MDNDSFLKFKQDAINTSNVNQNTIDTSMTENLGVTPNGLCKRFLHTNVCNDPDCKYIHDKSKARLCNQYLKGQCQKGIQCDWSHQSNINQGEQKPYCKYFNFGRGICNLINNPEHINDFKHVYKTCRDFAKGFCKYGKQCMNKHVTKKLCLDYAYGYCSKGPVCKDAHPKIFKISDLKFLTMLEESLKIIQCKSCWEIGHKPNNCDSKKELPLEYEIYCFKCQNVHTVDKCPNQLQNKQL